MKQMETIDFVIAWVDDNDLLWQNERDKYDNKKSASIKEYNFRDWGMLKYWFRGVEKYAPWVRKIYFVTYGHLPSWLNVKNEKLVIVNHKDYIPDRYLPTFSSHTIELNLHRIKGLSNKFVYFNDDMYLIEPVEEKDFFCNGMPCDCAVVNPIAPANNDTISHLMLTNISIINKHFQKNKIIKKNITKWFNYKYNYLVLLNMIFLPWDRFPGLLEKHIPTSFCTKTFDDVWRAEGDLLNFVCMHKFRDFKLDVNQWLVKEWQIAEGNFFPRSTNFGRMVNVSKLDDVKKIRRIINGGKNKILCVNDHLIKCDDEIINEIKNIFEQHFLKKSKFEI